jgi:hypothetical protein
MKSKTFSILLLFPFFAFGQNSFPSPQNLELQHWYSMGNYLQLNWDTPDTSQTNAQLVGYKVFRNFEVCDTIPSYSIDYLEYEPPFINGYIYYNLTAIYENPIGESPPTDTVFSQGPFLNIENEYSEFPHETQLLNNYPNPFNPNTTIEYYIPFQSKVKISIFDILGKKIETLVDEEKISGKYIIKFNGSKFPSGLYYYQLVFGNYSIIKRMVLLK